MGIFLGFYVLASEGLHICLLSFFASFIWILQPSQHCWMGSLNEMFNVHYVLARLHSLDVVKCVGWVAESPTFAVKGWGCPLIVLYTNEKKKEYQFGVWIVIRSICFIEILIMLTPIWVASLLVRVFVVSF